MTEQINIEKGIPLAPRPYRRGLSDAITALQVGESFLTDEETGNRVRSHASHIAKRKGMKFAVRKADGGFRVWRTA